MLGIRPNEKQGCVRTVTGVSMRKKIMNILRDFHFVRKHIIGSFYQSHLLFQSLGKLQTWNILEPPPSAGSAKRTFDTRQRCKLTMHLQPRTFSSNFLDRWQMHSTSLTYVRTLLAQAAGSILDGTVMSYLAIGSVVFPVVYNVLPPSRFWRNYMMSSWPLLNVFVLQYKYEECAPLIRHSYFRISLKYTRLLA